MLCKIYYLWGKSAINQLLGDSECNQRVKWSKINGTSYLQTTLNSK